MKLKFIKFFIKWIGTNLSIPFWIIGHVHLSMNIYEDIHELIASFAMNIIVATGFLIEWKETLSKNPKKR
jgi:hypothetical protein